jgi:arginyl-tRNA synthetase
MKTLAQNLDEQIRKAIQSLGVTDNHIPTFALQITKPEFEGDLTLVCFPFTKLLGKGPEQIGQFIGEYLFNHSAEVEKFNVVKGFLNLSISDKAWLAEFWEFTQSGKVSGLPKIDQKVLIEYSSPNTNKPLHLGHLRNNFLGSALSELLKFAGFEVIKANLVNDRGIHICKSMVAYQETGNGETPETNGLKGDHLVGKYYVKYDQILKSQISELLEKGSSEEEAKANAPIALHKLTAGTVAQSVPVLVVNDKSLTSESRITKLLASDWPVLVAVIVYWTVSPVSRAFGSAPVTLETYLVS